MPPSTGRVFTQTKRVFSGTHEYTSLIEVNTSLFEDTATMTFAPFDSLDIVFDREFVLDDLDIRSLLNTVNMTAQLLYPSGGKLLLGSGPDFSMNLPGDNNNWYKLPEWTRLRISINPASSSQGLLFVSVIGRG